MAKLWYRAALPPVICRKVCPPLTATGSAPFSSRLPIYNFGVPANLKNGFDRLARQGETFTYSETGPQGMLRGKRAFVVLSSDGTELGGPIDFASGYVRHMLNFFGTTDLTFVAADKLVFGAEEAKAPSSASRHEPGTSPPA